MDIKAHISTKLSRKEKWETEIIHTKKRKNKVTGIEYHLYKINVSNNNSNV
jgi:hypothetical protein